jgi:hypothetical protein
MRPLTAITEWPPIAVYDLEAAHWINIELVCHVDELGNRVQFKNTSDYLDWLFESFKGDVVFAHAGGSYDHLFLLQHIKDKGWSFRANLSGGTVVMLVVSNGKRTIRFGDSYRLMPDSLEKIGKTVKLPKLEVNPTLIHEMPPQEVLDYCYRDCEIVVKGLQMMRDTLTAQGADFAFTLASIASRYLRRTLQLDYGKFGKWIQGKWTPNETFKRWDKDCYEAYFGGRTDMFHKGVLRGRLFWYDIVSSYPSCMRNILPVYYEGYFLPPKKLTPKSIKNYLSFTGITDCIVKIPETEYIGCLPVKVEGDRLAFPVGRQIGKWTNIELMRAFELGYEFEHFSGQHRFEGMPLLRGFVDKFYKLRQNAKNMMDDFASYAFKILLNSSYGKTVETVDRTAYLTGKEIEAAIKEGGKVEATPCQGVFMSISHELGPFRHSAMGAYITAYARLRLFDMAYQIISAGGETYYCDTDSLMTNTKIPTTGSGLGDWELVDELSELEILLPKVYRAESATGKPMVYKCKGCPIVRKWESEDKPAERWAAFKAHGKNPTPVTEAILGKDGITRLKTNIAEGRLTPRRLEGPCSACKQTGLIAKHTCTFCNGTGRVLKPLVRSLKSDDKKRRWFGSKSKPLIINQ